MTLPKIVGEVDTTLEVTSPGVKLIPGSTINSLLQDIQAFTGVEEVTGVEKVGVPNIQAFGAAIPLAIPPAVIVALFLFVVFIMYLIAIQPHIKPIPFPFSKGEPKDIEEPKDKDIEEPKPKEDNKPKPKTDDPPPLPFCQVPLILPLPAPKYQDFDDYADHINPSDVSGLAHIIGRNKPNVQRDIWWADMQVRIPPQVFARGAALGLTRDQVIFPSWSRTNLSTKFEVDHIIEYQVLPIGQEAQFDRSTNYRLMDKSNNAASGASLAAGIVHLREALAQCNDPRAVEPFRFEGVAPTGAVAPEIWTRADLISGRHLDAYKALISGP
jgi:hypothetical protein